MCVEATSPSRTSNRTLNSTELGLVVALEWVYGVENTSIVLLKQIKRLVVSVKGFSGLCGAATIDRLLKSILLL